ncbi:MAG TPA: F0F1 ATP synthase subunit delta [Chloroflexota bacterium]|nr:F0F1 ATP synthase subunit delta [Chloroflexota bacterium]
MATSGVARRYARAIFDLAREEGDLDGWLQALQGIRDILGSPEFRVLLDNPGIAFTRKIEIVRESLPTYLSETQRNFVFVLIENRRTGLIDQILDAYQTLLNEARGIVPARVTTAVPLTPDESERVKQRLERIVGRQVAMATEVDPSIIGGFVARIGDRLIDASVAGRLAALRASLLA